MINKTKVIDTLCHLITTGDEVDRCYASRTLGVLGETQAIPTLVQCLRDEDVDVSIDAAEALGRIGDPTVVPKLLESLTHDPDGEVKTAVVEALGQIEGTDVIAPLLEVAKVCPDHNTWNEGNEWNAWWDMQLKAVKALGRKRVKEAVPILSAILDDDENQDIESEILIALALIGGEGEEILIQRLTKGSPRERRRAATALGLSHSTDARKALARALADPAGEVRVTAIRALAKQDAAPYLDIMLRFVNDPDHEMRRAAIEVITTLSANQDHAMLEKLAPLLTDPSPVVRATVLKAWYGIEHLPQKWLEQIRSCLSDSDSTVASAACRLLAHLGDDSLLPILLKILSNQELDSELRSQVATALGILGDLEALSILTWAIGDNVQSVRLAALNALMQLEKHQVSPDLDNTPLVENKTQDNEPIPRTPLGVVIAALKGEIVTPLVDSDSEQKDNSLPTPELTSADKKDEELDLSSVEKDEVLNSSSVEPVETAVSPSSETPDTAPPTSTLEAIERDNAALLKDKQLKDQATVLLEQPQGIATTTLDIQEYIDIAQDNIQLGRRLFKPKKVEVAMDVRHLSARILGDSDREEAVKALIEILNDEDPVLRREAATSMGLIAQRSPKAKGLTETFGSLSSHLNIGDPGMRLACVRTLGYLGNQSAIPVLFDSLQDEDPNVRTQTIQALIAFIKPNGDIVGANSEQIDVPVDMPSVNLDILIAKFVELLYDANINVCKAAAEALAILQHKDALNSIIDAALSNAGATVRDMGRVLRRLSVEESGAKLLKKLEDVPDSSHRRFVIEMLEEVFMPIAN